MQRGGKPGIDFASRECCYALGEQAEHDSAQHTACPGGGQG